MLKKFSRVLTIALLLMFVLQQAVLAVALEVDTASPNFKSDTWQNSATDTYPIEYAFSTTHTAGDGDGNPVERFCANVQDGAADVEGQLTFENGTAINNAVFPFKETVRIDSLTWKWNNGGRQYFMKVFTSMDNANWTEAAITGNASKVTVDITYNEVGELEGPAVECYATVPAGINEDTSDINPITFTLAQTPDAKYLKLVFYGNDGESGLLEVSHPWVSFNNMVIEGIVAPAPVEAVETSVDVPEAPPAEQPVVAAAPAAVTSAPQTGDADIIVFSLLGFVSFAAYTVAMRMGMKRGKILR